MEKMVLSITLVIFLFSVFAASLQFVTVQATTEISGIISSDTAWTKANSPYTLTGAVAIGKGVILTIEAGTTVNLNNYYIKVNGTLVAKGSRDERVTFTSSVHLYGSIAFSSTSSSWNEQTASGSIIENAFLDSTSISIERVSPAIISNTIIDANNYAFNIDGGSPIISNNSIEGNIGIHNSSPRITHNTITGGIGGGGYAIISNNTIRKGESGSGFGIICENASITSNVISDCEIGVGAFNGLTILEKNLVMNNRDGIVVGSDAVDYATSQDSIATIRHNTIVNNSVGISIQCYPPNPSSPSVINPNIVPTIAHNNLQDNTEYNLYLGSTLNLDAVSNWWGTTDESAISQLIYDFRSDFDLGTVTFKPFLTAQDPEAPSVPNVPPEPEPFPAVLVAVAVVFALAVVGIGLFIYFMKRKS